MTDFKIRTNIVPSVFTLSQKQFVIRVSLICQLIISSIKGDEKHRHLISVDEKTGIQALERKEALENKTKLLMLMTLHWKRQGC